MAKSNILRKINDSLLIEVKPKFSGNLILKTYSDEVIGNNVEHGVSVEFRIITDNIFHEDWKPLNNSNINGLKIQPNQIIQVKYTRTSENVNGNDYTFQSIEFDGDYEYREVVTPILNQSVFSESALDYETEKLAQNLFKKLYFRGIVPNYITRGANLSLKEDEDYRIFFSSISKFFAIILNFFRRFEKPLTDDILLREIIKQYGINFNEGNTSLEDLQNISKNIYNEVRKRGTRQIFDGEFLRLVHYNKDDELLYENVPKTCIGWCLGKSSPMYKGISDESVSLNKTGEDGADFQNLDNYTTHGSVSLRKYDNKGVLRIINSGGLGSFDGSEMNKKYFNINPNLDYELCFYLKTIDRQGELSISISGFDNLKNVLNDSFVHPNNDEVTEYALKRLELSKFSDNVWYKVRVILHAYYSENQDEKMNIGFGNNLYFNNPFIKYIIPNIHVEGGVCEICDYKLRPLVRGRAILPSKGIYNRGSEAFSLGFIQSGNFFHIYYKNNNNNQSQQEVTSIIERYLLPYSSTNLLTNINE